MTAKKDTRLARTIWDTLSALDVNEHVEKKGRFNYLSWTWAWATMMKHYPQTDYTITLESYQGDTMQVLCEITVSEHDERVTRRMWQAVMDIKNNAIKNPDACDINKSKMRCLVKTLAMFGLGHYIYAGEDLPEDDSKKLKKKLTPVSTPSKALADAHKTIRSFYADYGDIIYCAVNKNAVNSQVEFDVIQAAEILRKVTKKQWLEWNAEKTKQTKEK